MEISFFSDLHIQKPGDFADQLFERFCQNSNVQKSTHILLLGDMFDILIGEHQEYTVKYHHFFEQILQLLEAGKTVFYLEGNHDFHIQKTLEDFVSKNSRHSENFLYRKKGETLILNKKKFHFCHGHEVDYNNQAFKRWYGIYTSKHFNFLTSKILPYSLIEFLGEKAAGNSKKRGKKVFDLKLAKGKYIAGAKLFIDEKKIDGVICGHTHIQESHTYPDGSVYYNCGFPRKNQNFLHYNEEKGFSFLSLEES